MSTTQTNHEDEKTKIIKSLKISNPLEYIIMAEGRLMPFFDDDKSGGWKVDNFGNPDQDRLSKIIVNLKVNCFNRKIVQKSNKNYKWDKL